MNDTRLNIRVSTEFLARLEAYCKHHHVDKTAVTKIAITEYLDRHQLPEKEGSLDENP